MNEEGNEKLNSVFYQLVFISNIWKQCKWAETKYLYVFKVYVHELLYPVYIFSRKRAKQMTRIEAFWYIASTYAVFYLKSHASQKKPLA